MALTSSTWFPAGAFVSPLLRYLIIVRERGKWIGNEVVINSQGKFKILLSWILFVKLHAWLVFLELYSEYVRWDGFKIFQFVSLLNCWN